MWRIAVMILGFYAFSLSAKLDFSGDLSSLFMEQKPKKGANQIFGGLSFSIDTKRTKCELDVSGALLCSLFNEAVGKMGQEKCQVVFQKLNNSSSLSLPLIRLARQKRWSKENPLLTQYVEEKITTGVGELLLQSAQGFYLNNIALPLLLRAFDVVMQENTVISVTTKCDFRDWPAFEKEINSIETSLKKVAKN